MGLFLLFRAVRFLLAVQQPNIITQQGSMKYSRSTEAERRKSMGI